MSDIINKPWGYEQILTEEKDKDDNVIVTKNLVVIAGSMLSLQYHNKRREIWVVKHGRCYITLNKKKYLALPETQWLIPEKVIHRIAAIEDTVIWEHSSGYDPSDIVRIEDMYGRK